MDFAFMSCPYCGRTLDSTDQSKYVCQSCGKNIYKDRANVLAFIRPGEIEDRFNGIFDALSDGNEKKAREIAGDLVDSTDCCDHDSLFVRGYVYAEIGEDGKAFADWKKGFEMLSNDINLDAYICLVSKAMADMIAFKEKEFVEFNVVSYTDKLCEEIDSTTGMSCKAFVYYSIYRNCLNLTRQQDSDEPVELKDVLPNLFRRVVAYHRNSVCLGRIIEEYLDNLGYNPETFDEDDNVTAHVYDMIRICLEDHVSKMTEEDRIRVFDRWDDKSLKENIEPLIDSMVGPKKGLLGKLRKKDGSDVSSSDNIVHNYVDKYLLIDGPPEEPGTVDQ